jgi:hypothetical protein
MALTAKKVYAILKRQISDMEAKLNSPVRYRGTVATADLLPLNPDIGDMYNIESKSIYGEAGMNVAWNGVVWDTMGAPIDMSLYIKSNELADWVKQQNKPTYTAEEVGALPADTKIPSKTSELQNDSGFLTKIPDNYLFETDKTLNVSGKAADAKATGDKITELSADISNKLNKNQGSENSGKIAGINESGDIVPMFPVSVDYNEETNCLEFGSDQKMELNKGINLDSTLTKTGYAADAGAVGEITNSLKEEIAELSNKILYEEYADLLHGKEPKEKWYIDASNGTGRTLAQFFSYIDIDVSEYIGKKLYPYTSHKGATVYHSSRSVVFYDESGAFISGTGISSNNPINGIEVPKKSKTVSICFNYESDDNQPIKPQVYYLAINRENKNKLMLKNDVSIDYEQIQNKPIIPTKMSELENDIAIDNVDDVQTIRKPTISFIFDDGLPSTSDLVSLFDSYGWKCGFAILANSNLSNIKDNFLSYQSKGYEILSHSTDGVAMQDDSLTIDDVEAKMKKSKEILINNGFNITGWVTPSTWLNNKYFNNLCKYYEYGFGHLDTNQVVKHHVFWGNDIRQLERWSLQSKTLEQTKAEIDATINECGYLCFYAHAYPSTVNDNFTVENMKIIMDYIKKYIDNGKVQVLTPRCAINDYYTVRHSDLLDLYKKVIN